MDRDLIFGKSFVNFDHGTLGGYIEGREKNNIFERLNQALQSPEEKFQMNLYIAIDKISDEEFISNHERKLIEHLSLKLNNPGYKNPIAFVLGCLACRNKNDEYPNKTQLSKIFKILLSYKEEYNISEIDVIRYMRFAIKNGFELEEEI